MKIRLVLEYKELSVWRKLGVWGAIASMTALIIYITPLGSVLVDDHTLIQEGEIEARQTGIFDVYYPVPYSSPPELRWPDIDNGPDRSHFDIVSQRADGFQVHVHSWSSYWTDNIKWKARGVKKTDNSKAYN